MIAFFFLCAQADETLPELWTLLHEGELLHLIDGDPTGAIEIFHPLQEGISSSHPLYGRMLFALGRAYYDTGEKRKAKEEILKSIRSVYPPEEAVVYYVDMLAKEQPVQTLPYRGEPWFSLSDRDSLPNRYKASITQDASFFDEAQLTVKIQKEEPLSLSLFDVYGVALKEQLSFPVGVHSITLQRNVFPKNFSDNYGVAGIEIRTQNEGVFSVSQVVLQ